MARIDKLRSRRVDPLIALARKEREVYERLQEDDSIRYALGAMQPIDKTYTDNTLAEGDRIKGQLVEGYAKNSLKVDFEYQGSVTSDTHIRAHSDIDLLVLETRFIYLEPPLQPPSPYRGDAMQDLLQLRNAAELILREAYPAATVDCSGGKAISLSGGSLRRKIDVVISSWLDTPEYKNGLGKHFRGITVLDKSVPSRINNKPFLHNHRLAERDLRERGNLRKVIRLLKSLKYDSEPSPDISSYDIAAIAYAAPEDFWMVDFDQDLLLLKRVCDWVDFLCTNLLRASQLDVPNGTRRIFGDGGASIVGLEALRREIHSVLSDIQYGLSRSFRKLEEARIAY